MKDPTTKVAGSNGSIGNFTPFFGDPLDPLKEGAAGVVWWIRRRGHDPDTPAPISRILIGLPMFRCSNPSRGVQGPSGG